MSRILIADDSKGTRRIVQQLLTDLGHEVLEATDGAEALAIARQEDPDLMILDVGMPRMGGLDVAQEIAGQTPFVMLTGDDTPQTIQACLDRGAYGYQLKPIDPPRFLLDIKWALSRADELRTREKKIRTLQTALTEDRTTSRAIGIMMTHLSVTEDEAEKILKEEAAKERRRVAEVAIEITRSLNYLNTFKAVGRFKGAGTVPRLQKVEGRKRKG